MCKNIIPFVLVVCFVISCGYTTGAIQKAEKSFVTFSGNLESIEVYIDDLSPFIPSVSKHYQISPGTHTFWVYRDGQVVLNRVIILADQVVTEVNIP
jgi:hypothetical protein